MSGVDINPKLSVNFSGVPLTLIGPRVRNVLKITKPEVEKVIAQDFLSHLRKELRKNNLGLIPLRATTVNQKRKMGLKYPSVPMYGEGLDSPTSYISNIEMVETDKGIRVQPSLRSHHGGLTVMKLAVIQASGFNRGETVVPARNPIEAAVRTFKPKDSHFKVAKILRNRFRALWN